MISETIRTLLRIEHLNVSIGDADILYDVSLEIEEGQYVGIQGHSGSGKTMLAWSLLGLAPRGAKISGTVQFTSANGVVDLLNPDQLQSVLGREICLIPQNPFTSLNPSLTCGRQVIERIEGHSKIQNRDKALQLFGELGLEDSARIFSAFPHQLSGGQLQRVVMAMSLITEPSLVIADEPTTALDSITKWKVIELINKWRQTRATSLMVISHDSNVIGSLADVIYEVVHGTLKGTVSSQFLIAESPEPVSNYLERGAYPILSAINVSKSFGGQKKVKALSAVNLEVHDGESLGIVGGSGSGKTTLARVIAGLEFADEGMVNYQNEIADYRNNPESRRNVQMIFQDPYSALYPHRSVGYFIGEPLRLHFKLTGQELKSSVLELLDEVQLSRDYYDRLPNSLSGGERQRVQIARAIGIRPKVLICDECITGLDIPVQAHILGLLKKIHREHRITLIFISHDIAAIRVISETVAVMHNGKIVEHAPTIQVLANPKHEQSRQLVEAVSFLNS